MICRLCKKDLPEDSFRWKNRSLNKRQSICKECNCKQDKFYYEKNKKNRIQKVAINVAKRKSTLKEYLKNYLKTHPCVDCGFSDIRCLDFDHVRGKKQLEVTTMVQQGYSLERIKDEIEKCDIRCANCHRIRHSK